MWVLKTDYKYKIQLLLYNLSGNAVTVGCLENSDLENTDLR